VSPRSDTTIVALVLAAGGFVLVAPVLGRSGWPRLADAAMALAAAGGLGAFGLAGWHTLRAMRRGPSRPEDSEP
jgi:hypothetical protein